MNHNKVYRESGLIVPRHKPRKGIAEQRQRLMLPKAPNQMWSIVFVMDSLGCDRRIECLHIVDDITKECLHAQVANAITGDQIACTLDAIAAFRGYPQTVRADHDPKFTSKALNKWACDNGVRLKLIAAWKTDPIKR